MWKPQSKEALIREMKIREWRSKACRQFLRSVAFLISILARCAHRFWSWFVAKSSATAKEVERKALASKRHDLLLQLGEKAYQLYQSGAISVESLKPLCREIEELDGSLNDRAAEENERLVGHQAVRTDSEIVGGVRYG